MVQFKQSYDFRNSMLFKPINNLKAGDFRNDLIAPLFLLQHFISDVLGIPTEEIRLVRLANTFRDTRDRIE